MAELLAATSRPVPQHATTFDDLKGGQNRKVSAIQNMVSVLKSSTGAISEPQAASVQKTGQKLPRFKIGYKHSESSSINTMKAQKNPKQYSSAVPHMSQPIFRTPCLYTSH